jgi:polysaccharide biosynthesis transport protein
MKESFPEFNPPRLMPSPAQPRPNGFKEPRQEEGMGVGTILNGLRKYWYASVLTTAVMMGVIGYVTWKQVRIYRSAVQIAIDLKGGSSFAEKLAGGGGDGSGQSEDRTIAIETITQSLRSKSLIDQAIRTIPDPKLRPSVAHVLAGLAIQSKPDSNVLTVSYTSLSPTEIVAVLNSLSKVYIDYSIKTKKARTNNSIEFIESQLPASRKRLQMSASHIEQFRIKYRFVDPATSAGALDGYRQSIVAKINEARSTYYQTQQQYQELKKQLNSVGLSSDGNLSTTMLTQDSGYQALFTQLKELELKYNQESVRFSPENPLIVALKEKRDGVLVLLRARAQQVLKRKVADGEINQGISTVGNNLAQNLANRQSEIETTLVAQAAQSQSLDAVYQQIQTQIAQLPGLQKQYTELQREYQIASQELTAFLQKVQELKIVNAEQVVPWKLLDPPEFPNSPVSPDVPRQMGLGAIGSILAGILVAVGLNKLDDRVDNPDSVKAMTGMPILSLIPRVEDLERSSSMRGSTFLQTFKGKSKDYSYWSFVESIRTLALGIGLTSDRDEQQSGKVIAMTSSLPKEGKSTIAFHTANTLAELGYRVLLIDADMHKSSIAQLCATSPLFKREDCDDEDGLSDAIVGNREWQDLIKISPESKLNVMFSGKQTVSSIVLFNSPRLLRLMDEWRTAYDYILFDTPPIVGVSDTRLLSSLVDGLVYIVSLNVAQKQIVDRGIDIISSLKTTVLGLAINRVENHHSGYNKYYQYYQASHELHEKTEKLKSLNPEKQGVEV